MAFLLRFPKHEKVQSVYETLLHVFDGKTLGQSDATNRLEPIFMMGMSTPYFSTREKFFQLFSGPTVGGTLFQCLNYCFSERHQRWEHSKGVFWVRHCLDVVLSGASTAIQICPAPGVHRLPPLVPIAPTSTMQSQFKAVPSGTTNKEVTQRIIDRLTAHESWLEGMREVTTESIIQPLRTLCYISQDLACVTHASHLNPPLA